MTGTRARRATGAAPTAVTAAVLTGLTLVAVTGLTGCSDGDSASSTVSKAASAARSAGEEATAAASSLASEASSALASATAEAGRRLDDIKGGVDAKGSVELGKPTADGDRTKVEVTAKNSTDSTKSFAVQVDFTDQAGNLLDTVVLTVSDVPAGDSGKATARSNRQLTGEARAEVARAVRY
ncbi:FxLYD domain-containing protein [Streptomyces sp. NPDC050997]|uniref:FxLYD domain-containing protein n=1 Tax=Streptomyces sp. NPDC050997 TaxID=3155519 RepID=UPI003421ECB6